MGFDFFEFLGAAFVTWFLGLVVVVTLARGFKVENPAPCWVAGAVVAAVLGAIGLSPSSIAAGAATAVYFIVMALRNKPPPKLS